MLIRILFPFLYSLLIGCVWGAAFKKKFADSLAPAFMIHIILVLISGMLFSKLSTGIYSGIAIAFISGVILLIKKRHSLSKEVIIKYMKQNWSEGLCLFSLFYIFCFISNYGKRFNSWDEFSFWGMFIKESLRLDKLYCMSPLTFGHKDYVPAISLFEVIWCRLVGRFSEQDAYRAIQILMFSFIMPMFERFSDETVKLRQKCVAISLILLVPLVFDTENGFFFYHSIYCDIALGVIFFWAVLEAYRSRKDLVYQTFLLTIGLTVMALSKMTAMAFLPLVIGLFFARIFFFSDQNTRVKRITAIIPITVIPVTFWYIFNRFVDKFIDNTGNRQSYDGMKLSSMKEVFANAENSSITYLSQVRNAFIDTLIHKDILIHGSYVVVTACIVVSFVLLSSFIENEREKQKAIWAGIWVFASGTYYALLNYFLYCTAFSEYEAVRLASYARYMNSFVIAALLFLIAVYFDSGIWRKHQKILYLTTLILFLDLAFFHVSAFDQVLPGMLTQDEDNNHESTMIADYIMDCSAEDDAIYVINRKSGGEFVRRLRFYCDPRTIDGGSIGPAVDDEDRWSYNKTSAEFVESVKDHDYLYICEVDEAFLKQYSSCFANPDLLAERTMYKITGVDSLIHLKQI